MTVEINLEAAGDESHHFAFKIDEAAFSFLITCCVYFGFPISWQWYFCTKITFLDICPQAEVLKRWVRIRNKDLCTCRCQLCISCRTWGMLVLVLEHLWCQQGKFIYWGRSCNPKHCHHLWTPFSSLAKTVVRNLLCLLHQGNNSWVVMRFIVKAQWFTAAWFLQTEINPHWHSQSCRRDTLFSLQ